MGGNSSDYIHQVVIGWGSPRAMESLGVRHCPILFFLCVCVCGGAVATGSARLQFRPTGLTGGKELLGSPILGLGVRNQE